MIFSAVSILAVHVYHEGFTALFANRACRVSIKGSLESPEGLTRSIVG